MNKNLPAQQSTDVATIDPVSLIKTAVEQNFDIDKLKQLMDLQERWEAKQAKKSFLSALSRFQTMVPVLKKTKTANVNSRTGGSFKYKYADLGSITQTIKKPLQECGLSYRWEFAEANGKMKVTCFVSHIDGHTETTTMEAAADNSGAKNDIQQKGSTHTYLQRYTLIGALGLSTADEDNDAKGTQQAEPQPQKSQVTKEPPTKEEALELWKDTIDQVKTKIHLNALYLQNKAVVDADPEIQALFKEKENKLKQTEGANTKTVLP